MVRRAVTSAAKSESGSTFSRRCPRWALRRPGKASGFAITYRPADIEENQGQNDGSHRHAGACSGTAGGGDVVHSTRSRIHHQGIRQTDEKHQRRDDIHDPLGHESEYRAGWCLGSKVRAPRSSARLPRTDTCRGLPHHQACRSQGRQGVCRSPRGPRSHCRRHHLTTGLDHRRHG